MRPKPSTAHNATAASRPRARFWDEAEPSDPIADQVARVRAFVARFDGDTDVLTNDRLLLEKLAEALAMGLHDRRAAAHRLVFESLKLKRSARQIVAELQQLDTDFAGLVPGSSEDAEISRRKPSKEHAYAVLARLATLAGALDCKRCRPSSPDFTECLRKATGTIRDSTLKRAIKRRPSRR